MGTYSLGPMPLGVTEGVAGGGGGTPPSTPVILAIDFTLTFFTKSKMTFVYK